MHAHPCTRTHTYMQWWSCPEMSTSSWADIGAYGKSGETNAICLWNRPKDYNKVDCIEIVRRQKHRNISSAFILLLLVQFLWICWGSGYVCSWRVVMISVVVWQCWCCQHCHNVDLTSLGKVDCCCCSWWVLLLWLILLFYYMRVSAARVNIVFNMCFVYHWCFVDGSSLEKKCECTQKAKMIAYVSLKFDVLWLGERLCVV
jgi:hypothetical protein